MLAWYDEILRDHNLYAERAIAGDLLSLTRSPLQQLRANFQLLRHEVHKVN